MHTLLRLVDAALLIAAGSLGAILLQGQGHTEASYAPLVVGVVGSCIAWLAG